MHFKYILSSDDADSFYESIALLPHDEQFDFSLLKWESNQSDKSYDMYTRISSLKNTQFIANRVTRVPNQIPNRMSVLFIIKGHLHA